MHIGKCETLFITVSMKLNSSKGFQGFKLSLHTGMGCPKLMGVFYKVRKIISILKNRHFMVNYLSRFNFNRCLPTVAYTEILC